MRIRISDPALVGDLLDYFRGTDCDAIQTARNIVSVSLSQGLPYETARLELGLHLADWRQRHADASAVVID